MRTRLPLAPYRSAYGSAHGESALQISVPTSWLC